MPLFPRHAAQASPQRLRWIPTTLALAVLAACGGGGDDEPTADPLATYRQQVLNWQDCPAQIQEDEEGNPLLTDGRTQCATLRAPMDYANPAKGDIEVGMLRIAAGQPQHRRGALWFNPGGPGVDGLTLPLNVGGLWHIANPDTDSGRLLRQLSDEFELIGFSPRGVGSSTQLHCESSAMRLPVDDSTHSQTPENIDNILRNAEHEAQACLANPLTPYISTEHVAQDMDLMRAVLGEDKLNYFGYSYGTRLGAWYAARFPDRVGRMLLDSSMDFSRDTYDLLSQPLAFQRVLDAVLAPYAARHPDAFDLGTDVSAIRAILPSLSAPVQTALQATMGQGLYQSQQSSISLAQLAAGQAFDALLNARPGAGPDAIEAAINAHVFAPTSEGRDDFMRETALQLHQSILTSALPTRLTLTPTEATQRAVHCNDMAVDTSIPNWIERRAQIIQQYPIGIGSYVEHNPCLFWGGPRVTKPAIDTLANADILFVQSQYDGATWTEGALDTVARLPKAHLVYVQDEYTHALFPYGTACVDNTVANYLLGTAPAARETRCDAKPLPRDVRSAPLARTAAAPPNYTDPALAQVLQGRIQQLLQP